MCSKKVLAAVVAMMCFGASAEAVNINCREENNPNKDTVTALAEVAVIARMKQKND